MFRILTISAVALAVSVGANAAKITATGTPLSGNTWSAQFNVANDGTPTTISGFTIYFPAAEFTSLTLIASPSTWDALVIQPDLALPAAGFLDSLAISAGDELALGQSVGGFEIGFTFLGQSTPASLAFDIVDRNYTVLFSGYTTELVAPPVPEPPTLAILALGLLGIWLHRCSRSAANQVVS